MAIRRVPSHPRDLYYPNKKAGGSTDLEDIANVNITSVADDDFLVYDSAAGEWVNRALALADITSGMVTQHQADLTIYESQIANLNHYIATLGEIGDVTLGAINDGEGIAWDSSLGIWQPVVLGGGSSFYQKVARDGFATMTQRETLRLIGGTGITLSNADDATNDESEITITRDAMSLNDLSGVAISGPVTGRVLYYDGTSWRDVSRATAGIPGLADANDFTAINDFQGGVTLSGVSDLNSKGNSNMQRHYGPGFSTADNSLTGTFAIKVPAAAIMHAIRVTIYEYASESGAVELLLGGYSYTSGPSWVNTSAGGYGGYISGADALEKYGSVRFVYDSGGEGFCILIGDSGTTWHYPKIFVEDLQGHNVGVAPTIGFYEAGVNAEPTWEHITTEYVNRSGPVKNITTSTTTPTGEVPYGTLHLIY